MNLCFLSEQLRNIGDEKNLSALLSHLSEAGHDISVILLESDRTPDGYPFAKIYPVKVRGNKFSAFRKRKAMIRKIMLENTYDAAISFGSVCNIASVLSLSGVKTPLILCERNDPAFVPSSIFLKGLRKLTYPFATAYVFQTEEQRDYFPDKIQQRSYVIPNFLPQLPAQEEMKECSVAAYSRLDNEQKNLFMLFDAFSDFAKTYPEYTLKIFGEGPDKEQCEEYVKQIGNDWNIKLMGEPEDVLNQIQKSQIFVLTSNYEGMPNALLAAMSMGMTCVSTDCGGAKELIQNGKSGVLVPKNDVGTLSEALSYLADHEDVRKQLGEKARLITEFFTSEKIIPLWEEAFKQIVSPLLSK